MDTTKKLPPLAVSDETVIGWMAEGFQRRTLDELRTMPLDALRLEWRRALHHEAAARGYGAAVEEAVKAKARG